jgi:predicted Zn-dependent peptidase
MPIELAGRDQRAGSTRTLSTGPDGGVVRRTVLPGGLRVISESVPGVRSVAFGVWVGIGSRDETLAQAGASHYLEHLLFKGTKRRDALTIAAELEAVGGELNAFTAKEYTCYYARVLDNDLPLAVDVICDMITSSLIASRDVDSERTVILEEIAMHDDDPGDAVHDTFAEIVWPRSPLGRPVLGTVDSITSISRQSVANYYRRHYSANNLVIAAAGNLDHGALVRLVKKAFAGVQVDDKPPSAPRVGGRSPGFVPGRSVVRRPTEQANLVIGTPGLPRLDERRFSLGVLNAAVGGGMSSRLFQEVREKRGLAYSIYSFSHSYSDGGIFGIYAGTGENEAAELMPVLRDELRQLVAGLSSDELARARAQLKAGLLMSLEGTTARCEQQASHMLIHGRPLDPQELVGHIDAVDEDAVVRVAKRIIAGKPTVAALGPVGKLEKLELFAERLRS